MFADLVDSTAQASRLGDRAWRTTLEQHHQVTRQVLARCRGVEQDMAGDGVFATFDGPGRAIACARALRQALAELGLQLRIGLHTGECEVMDAKVAGIAVHIGARVAEAAAPDQILVSRTVADLVAGSGLALEDRGTHQLKGIPGDRLLFSVEG
jgi:class 3 adenylate cyclase